MPKKPSLDLRATVSGATAMYDAVASLKQSAQHIPRNGDAPGSEPAESPHLSDMGNARRLAVRHGDNLKFCRPLGWLTWSGKNWILDEDGAVHDVQEMVTSLYTEAAPLESAQRKTLVAHALKSESEPRLRAALSLAESERLIAVRVEELDRDPWVLNVQNGTIELKTGELRPHRREDLFTKIIPVSYDRGADCPRWLAFLDRIFASYQPLIDYMQRAVGYSLTGVIREQVLFLLYGLGQNGKTTFLNIVRKMLGTYAAATPAETLLVRRGDPVRTDLARLAGMRFVCAIEADADRRLAEAMVKSMTGGDPVTARHLYQKEFTFEPTMHLWLACNHKPIVRGTDLAIWRRIRLVPFTVTIPAAEQDLALEEKLHEELPGILNWAVGGCLAWQRLGLAPPDAVTRATAGYRQEMDVLADFLAERCVTGPEAGEETGKNLYSSYKNWAVDVGVKPMANNLFAVQMQERGFNKLKKGHANVWRGVRLRTPLEDSNT